MWLLRGVVRLNKTVLAASIVKMTLSAFFMTFFVSMNDGSTKIASIGSLGKFVPIFGEFNKTTDFALYLSIRTVVFKRMAIKNVTRSIFKHALPFLTKYYTCQTLSGKFVPIFGEFNKTINFALYLSIRKVVFRCIALKNVTKSILKYSCRFLIKYYTCQTLLGKFIPIFNSLAGIKKSYWKVLGRRTWEITEGWNIQIAWKMKQKWHLYNSVNVYRMEM